MAAIASSFLEITTSDSRGLAPYTCRVKRVLLVAFCLLVVVVALSASPRAGAVLVIGLLAAGVALGSRRRAALVPTEVPYAPAVAKSTDGRVQNALRIGTHELEHLGLPYARVEHGLEVELHRGRIRVDLGYYGEVPHITVRGLVGEQTEFAFVVRRRQSPIGLPPLVDNTPLDTTMEYRLKHMGLNDENERIFKAASNRPRAFRELQESGLEEDLLDASSHARHRLEDLTYSGLFVAVTMQPAADPATAPWLLDAVQFAVPFIERMQSYLAAATIPNAQG